jgi:hypothetical protein
MSQKTQRPGTATEPTYGVVGPNIGSVKSGLGFTAAGVATLKDTAGADQLTVATTGVSSTSSSTTTLTSTGTIRLGSATAGAATSTVKGIVKKTGIADNTATSVLTVTVPNVNAAAAIKLTFVASLGTGTDTFESTRVADGNVVLARQAGANVVATAVALTGAGIATVSGGGTLTLAYSVAAVAGAVGATNTFDIQVTLVKTGTITDLQCVVLYEVINAETGGVTVAAA